MDKEPALNGDGAKEPQDLINQLIIVSMSHLLPTNVPVQNRIETLQTETIIVMDEEPALNGDGAKEPQDDPESNL